MASWSKGAQHLHGLQSAQLLLHDVAESVGLICFDVQQDRLRP